MQSYKKTTIHTHGITRHFWTFINALKVYIT